MKRTFLLITAGALTLGLFSCGSPHAAKNSKPVLNDWQKEVLAAEDATSKISFPWSSLENSF